MRNPRRYFLKWLAVGLCLACAALLSSCLMEMAACGIIGSCIGNGGGCTSESDNKVTYELNDDGKGYCVSKVGKDLKKVAISEEYDGKPVTRIAENAFCYLSNGGCSGFYWKGLNLESLSMPATIGQIDEHAFRDGEIDSLFYGGTLSDWYSIAFGSTPLSSRTTLYIGNEALREFSVPEGITVIGANTFANYRFDSINIPAHVDEIGNSAFRNSNVSVLTFEEGVRTIGTEAFNGCVNLTEIVLPDSAVNIASNSFAQCDNVITLSVGAGISVLDNLFGFNYIHFLTLRGDITVSERLYVTDNDIRNVTFSGKADVGDEAFSDCVNLTNVIFNGETVLGVGVFKNCTSLMLCDITGATLSKIPDSAFYGCGLLGHIMLPDSVTEIGNEAFKESGLKLIDLEHVTAIGFSAFSDCAALEEVAFGHNLSVINSYAFMNCANLAEIDLQATNLTEIPRLAFSGCIRARKLVLPESLLTIGSVAFSSCERLLSVTIPQNVTHMESNAFWLCGRLAEIYNLSGVSVEDMMETGISEFAVIHSSADEPSRLIERNGFIMFDADDGQYLMAYVGNDDYITLPDFADGAYKLHSAAFRNCEFSGIVIPEGISAIPDSLFYDCLNLRLVQLPAGIESIGDSAFYGCKELPELNIPETVTEIGWYAFQKCQSFVSIRIPAGVTAVSPYLFYGCGKLEAVELSDSVTEIGMHAFYDCRSLYKFSMPSAVVSVGRDAFYGCTLITETDGYQTYAGNWLVSVDEGAGGTVNVRPGTVGIADSAFGYTFTGNFGRVTLPDGVKYIGDYAFANCAYVNEIDIPSSVCRMGDNVFLSHYFDYVIQINYSGTKQEWEAIEKGLRTQVQLKRYKIICTDGIIS